MISSGDYLKILLKQNHLTYDEISKRLDIDIARIKMSAHKKIPVKLGRRIEKELGIPSGTFEMLDKGAGFGK